MPHFTPEDSHIFARRPFIFLFFYHFNGRITTSTSNNPLWLIFSTSKAFWKAFALKGNVIDLAVAVVIGGAFNKIVSVFVSSIITPIIGYLTSGVNLAYLVLKLGDVELKYGELLQATIDFLIIAFSVFVAIKLIGALRRKSEEAPAAPAPKPDDVVLLEQIRDILQKQADAK